MRKHRTQHLTAALSDLPGITATPGRDTDRASPASPFTRPRAGIEVSLLFRRDHGAYPLPGMMLNNKSSKLAALSPN
jgi:hypothetical protein